MKKENGRLNIVYIGRYNESEILSGPEKTAKRIFELCTKENSASFIQYFFDGRKYGLMKKLFGKDEQQANGSTIYTVGLLKILPLLFRLKPAVIHIITFERFAVIPIFIKLFKKVKIIYSSHGVIFHENSKIKHSSLIYTIKDKICERFFLKYSDVIIFPSEQALDTAQKYFNINESKIRILANGIDGQFYSSSQNKSLNRNKTLKAVVMNSSAYHTTGIGFLNKFIEGSAVPIEIFSIGSDNEIHANNPNIKITYVDKMPQKQLCDFYKDKDIFFALNNYDTFSISAAEAMSAGLIPIATEQTGFSRFIINCENGFTVQYGDVKTLLKIVENLSQNPELRSKISSECRNIFPMLLWSEVYESYCNIYKNMC